MATRVDGAADIIVPGENGWLVEVGDMEGFGRRLIELAADPAARARMGAAGLARVEEYSAARMVRRLETIYTALAEDRPVPEAEAFRAPPGAAGAPRTPGAAT